MQQKKQEPQQQYVPQQSGPSPLREQPGTSHHIPEHVRSLPESMVSLWLWLSAEHRPGVNLLREDMEKVAKFIYETDPNRTDTSASYMMGPPQNCPACGKPT